MSQTALQQRLEALSAEGAERFEPARFGYIRALNRRAEQQRSPVNQALLQKAEQALSNYQNDWQDARTRAQSIVNDINQLSNEEQSLAATLFRQGDFKKLPALKEQLLRQQAQQLSLNDLSQLTESINATVQAEQQEDKQLSFDELLQQQEQATLVELVGEQHSSTQGAKKQGAQLELQSMKHYREAMKYHNIDQLVNRAINEGPENPGPLNPQMLAIKSLSQMRNCSEQYSRRFASYIDTLLWLEKAGSKLPTKGGK